MATSEHTQSVRNAWINRLRDEALRMRRPEVSKCAHIGILIATYADADGTNAFPGGKTLGAIAGCTEDTVTRAVKVLMAVGLLQRKRRPNQSSVYLLVVPMGKPVPWDEHLHLYTDTRQARRKKALQEKEATVTEESGGRAGAEAPESVPERVPEPVPAGGSGTRYGTGAEPVAERIPEPVAGRDDHYRPTYGRDPGTDHNRADVVTQQQVVAHARGEDDQSPQGERLFGRCAECGVPLARPGTTRCSVHRDPAPGQRGRSAARRRPIQGPLLMPVPDTPDASSAAPQAPFSRPADPFAPVRLCGCGREYRDRRPGGQCPDCMQLAHEEAARLGIPEARNA